MNSHQSTPSGSPATRKSGRKLAIILLAVAAVAIASLFLLRPEPVAEGNLSGASIGGNFALVDENGRTVSSESFDGKWRLMYFGFTYCPDVCPTDVAKLAAGFSAFEKSHPEAARNVQPLFITVDPERDTPAVMREFTDAFHPRLLGLTGSRPQIDAALKTFRVYASKVPGVSADSYTFDHLAIIYLMDPKGRPVEFITGASATPEDITEMLVRFVG